jgi:hypothetical protein
MNLKKMSRWMNLSVIEMIASGTEIIAAIVPMGVFTALRTLTGRWIDEGIKSH